MRFAPFARRVRLALIAPAELELHLPSRCPWAELRRGVSEPRRWGTALQGVPAFAPDVLIAADPHELPPADLDLPSTVKVAMITGRASPGELARLGGRVRASPAAGWFDHYTWFEAPPREVSALPFLQVLPLPVDTARCLPAPRLDLRRVLVPEWARPPASCLARLRRAADVTEIPRHLPATAWPELMGSAGILVHWSRAAEGHDPLLLAALANGLLVVTNTPFPEAWGIEPEDEYLPRPGQEALLRAVEESVRIPEATRAVRVRAWQKAREAFAADEVFHRLVHDALLWRGSPLVAVEPGGAG